MVFYVLNILKFLGKVVFKVYEFVIKERGEGEGGMICIFFYVVWDYFLVFRYNMRSIF